MLCFKDMTFCNANCSNKKCERNWKLRDKTDYYMWCGNFPTGDGPVAFSDFSEVCKDYKPNE